MFHNNTTCLSCHWPERYAYRGLLHMAVELAGYVLGPPVLIA